MYLVNIDNFMKDIGLKRTKEKLKQYVLNKYVEIHQNKELKKFYNLKTGLFKQFREELIPLYLYSQLDDSNDDREYQIIVGEQPFDAIIFNRGAEKKLEFTEYIDGKQIKDDSKILEEEHIINFEIPDCFSVEEKYFEMYENLVKKKQSKMYNNTLIIFIVSPFNLDFISNDEIGRIKDCLINIIKKYDFGTNSVSLLVKHSGNITWGTIGEIYNIY